MYWDEKRYSPRPGVHALGAPLRRRQHGPPERERQAVEVPQGKTKTVRLRQLPRGTVLGVAISVSGKLPIALVSAAQLKSPKPEPLFRGAAPSRSRQRRPSLPKQAPQNPPGRRPQRAAS